MAETVDTGILEPSIANSLYERSPNPYLPDAIIKEAQKHIVAADAQGSIIINGKTSYSGADIKVVCHVYDNGQYANWKIQDLTTQKQTLTDFVNTNHEKALSYASEVTDPYYRDSFSQRQFQLAVMNTEVGLNTLDAIDQQIAELNVALKSGYSTKILAELQTISVSIHREKTAVRAMSTAYPKGFTRGTRSIAGSMIFTVFDQNVLQEFLYSHPSDYDAHNPTTTALLDQIPPFDITIVFANELGQISRMAIYGVEFVNEGQTMSIEDMLIENVVQYVARDVDPMRVMAKRKIDLGNRMSQDLIPLSGSSLLNDDTYSRYKEKIDPYTRFKNRVNPFL